MLSLSRAPGAQFIGDPARQEPWLILHSGLQYIPVGMQTGIKYATAAVHSCHTRTWSAQPAQDLPGACLTRSSYYYTQPLQQGSASILGEAPAPSVSRRQLASR